MPTGVTFAEVEATADQDASVVHRLISSLSERLHTPLDPILDVLDYPRRTYFTHKKEGTLPGTPDLPGKVVVLASLADEDEAATRLLVDNQREDIKQLLSEGQIGEVRHRLRRARRGMAGAPDATEDPKAIVAQHLDEMERLVDEPGFAVAARAVEWFAERGSLAGARLIAIVQLERALRAARTGDDVAPAWDFLPALRFEAMDALRARAQAYIDSDMFTAEGWNDLVRAEADATWATRQHATLAPDPVEPAPAEGGSWRYLRPTIAERMSR